MKKFFADFKKFISRGNIVDMAIGVIVGNAFSAIVKAFTDKVIMPLINTLLSLGGDNGLESAYTFLKTVKAEDGTIDLAKSIYIDWGAFITAILNFFIIALTLFIILKVAMKSRQMIQSVSTRISKGQPTEEEKKVLKERGVSRADRKAYKEALIAYRKEVADKKAAEEANKPLIETDIDILKDIRELLKSNAEAKTDSKK
ncbi:MAG: large conductance mechanosensitive channel protein MscL [Clostridiales bacterium]|nr:large conductance mechanosensitive channel protein MscL [Clostridiales bacterium]